MRGRQFPRTKTSRWHLWNNNNNRW